MNRNELLIQWLGDRQRKYADGVSLFQALARPAQKEKYASYFTAVTTEPHPFDPHFTQLINCLSRISRSIRESPELYPAAAESVVQVKELTNEQKQQELERRTARISESEEQLEELTERMESLQADNEDHSDEIATLQEQIDALQSEQEQLRKEVDVLNAPGVKIVTEASMPPSIRKAYARIKEITPLYASLHNDIAQESLSEEERKPLADELCRLDDERRKLWKTIDAWSEGKGTLQLEEQRPTFSENPVVRGIELMRHVKRLKQNIANSRKAAEKAKEEGRQVVYENAMKRIAGYEADLAETEEEIAGEKISG